MSCGRFGIQEKKYPPGVSDAPGPLSELETDDYHPTEVLMIMVENKLAGTGHA
jgi:hypothetical protein